MLGAYRAAAPAWRQLACTGPRAALPGEGGVRASFGAESHPHLGLPVQHPPICTCHELSISHKGLRTRRDRLGCMGGLDCREQGPRAPGQPRAP